MNLVKLRRRGMAAVEFVLWLPILALLAGGVVDFSWYMSRSYHVSRAVRDAARIAAATPDQNGGADVEGAARDHLIGVLSALGMPCGAGCEIEVRAQDIGFWVITTRVDYPYQKFFGLVPTPEYISYEFTMALELEPRSRPR